MGQNSESGPLFLVGNDLLGLHAVGYFSAIPGEGFDLIGIDLSPIHDVIRAWLEGKVNRGS